jgi:hypothetical protein
MSKLAGARKALRWGFMGTVFALISLVLLVFILWDSFEAMIFPRRVTRTIRPTRFFYQMTWMLWSFVARRMNPGRRRETFLSIFGPLSLLALFATWVSCLIFCFALLHWSLATPMHTPDEPTDFATYWYLSGTTFFTLGFGDVTPVGTMGRFLAILESGLGFGFMAVIIGYLPVLFQAFSRRETTISLLDARAGSPPSASQLLLRLAQARQLAAVGPYLEDWERWAAELLESHLSFPVLSFYRSQHDNQSWLSALTAILDTCALLLSSVKSKHAYQAQLTFAMARHAAVDLALVFKTSPRAPHPDRLSAERCLLLKEKLRVDGLELAEGETASTHMAELRAMYEPFVNALAEYLLLALPPILPEKSTVDNWQTTAWARRAPGIGRLTLPSETDEHFD